MAGALPIRAGALAQLKASIANCKLALLWPDPMLNLGSHTVQALPIFDCVASYSEAAAPYLERLGAKRTIWLCFAADPELHRTDSISAADRAQYGCDISFVGNMRPERERAICALIAAGLDVKVWGERAWLTQVRDKPLAKAYFRGGPLFGAAYYKAMRVAKVGLNVIDDTNYPAANMRFFEGLACGAAMLSSACPELEGTFRHREHILYYRSENELIDGARELLRNDDLRATIARNGERLVLSAHTYRQRAETLLEALYSQ
jgi:spore maturation protein CgeB